MDREQQIIDAALRYQALLDRGEPVSVRAFVASEPAELRDDVQEYLEMLLLADLLQEPTILSADEQALAQRIAPRARAMFHQRLAALAPPQTLTALRQVRKLTLRDVATQMNLPVDLPHRIERGGVRVGTIPHKLVARLATVLAQAEDTIQAAFAAPPGAAATRLSAQDATERKEEAVVDWADALAASTATDAQKAEWA